MSFTFKFRRGTAAEWTLRDHILAAGEPGLETDTGKLKFGDGTSRWSQLPYFASETSSPPTEIEVTRGTAPPTEATQGPFYLQVVT